MRLGKLFFELQIIFFTSRDGADRKHGAGKRIPEDYSVAGFDGIEMGKYYYPTLTTMRQPCEEMARETMKILFSRIEDEKGNKHKVFEAELQEGGSVRRIKA